MTRTRFVDDDLWAVLRTRLARAHDRVLAAVSYVTTDVGELGEGDTLIVDASPAALRAGATDPAVLRRCLKRRVVVYSVVGLHAKLVLVDDNWLLVGSANWSRRSATHLREAGLVTSSGAAIASARSFVHRLLRDGRRVDDIFVNEAAKLYRPPRFVPGAKRRHPRTARPESACWLAATWEDNEHDAFAERHSAAMQGKRKHRSWDVSWTRLYGNSRLVRDVREGDRVVFIHEEAGRVRVLSPAPVLGVRRNRGRTYVYTEAPTDVFERGLSWRAGKAWLTSLGVRPTSNSQRALPRDVGEDLERSWKRARRSA